MSKPREWWIRPDASYAREFVWPPDYDWMGDADDKVHVIEKSAYDELLAEAMDLRSALGWYLNYTVRTPDGPEFVAECCCKDFDKFLADRGIE